MPSPGTQWLMPKLHVSDSLDESSIEKTLLPYFLDRYPGHELGKMDRHQAAKLVRGMAERGDSMCRDIFRVQAHALGLFFDQMVNTFDPDALIVGGGAIEVSADFRRWFLAEIAASMPIQRQEQADIPIRIMPNGDTASARELGRGSPARRRPRLMSEAMARAIRRNAGAATPSPSMSIATFQLRTRLV